MLRRDANKTWTIGIDPGFGETAITLYAPGMKPAQWATYKCGPEGGEPGVIRALALSEQVVHRVREWANEYVEAGCPIVIGIETPVYKQNPIVFGLQMRLLQEIEVGLYFTLASEFQTHLFEVNPISSKLTFAGKAKATKDDMIDAAKRMFPVFWAGVGGAKSTREAVADALGHGYTAAITYASGDNGYNLSQLKMAVVSDVQEDDRRREG